MECEPYAVLQGLSLFYAGVAVGAVCLWLFTRVWSDTREVCEIERLEIRLRALINGEQESENEGKIAQLEAEVKKGDTLRRVQRELKPWVSHNFGEREPWQPLLGIGEEVGELMHAHLKAHQGIRSHENHSAAKIDALADIIIFACDYATAEGIDIADALATTWDQVKKRDWRKDPEHSHKSGDAGGD